MFLSEERVRKGAEKLSKFLNAKQQGRLDGFFTVQPKTSPKKDDDKGKGKGKGKGKDEPKGTKRKVRQHGSACFLVPVLRMIFRPVTRTTRRQVVVRRQKLRSEDLVSVIILFSVGDHLLSSHLIPVFEFCTF